MVLEVQHAFTHETNDGSLNKGDVTLIISILFYSLASTPMDVWSSEVIEITTTKEFQ